MFMGALLEKSGVGDKLYEVMHLMMGGVRGGLASATIVISSLFAACTGVVSASVTTVGFLTLPGMLKRHYNKGLACGTVMAGGCLGMLIPPSIMLVVIGAWSELSVGKLYLAAFFPGLLVSLLYIIYISIRCGRNPNLGPPLPIEERRASVGHKIQLLFVGLLPPLFLIFAVLGTIIFGIATTTEAAGMGALGSIMIVALNRRLSLSTFLEACYRTVRLCGMIAVIACGALTFASAFLGLGGGELIEDSLLGLGVGPLGVLAIMLLCLLVMGAFMDWFEILVIIIPIFYPIAQTLGLDLIWFSILIAVVLQTSFLTPP
ncbi:MAG: TRAP transporter large permease subunit, partial [Candidatus Contubernalis sp.]|nr:TRAP transporter large permease subunit [Candidatus Contubernalis sp.]